MLLSLVYMGAFLAAGCGLTRRFFVAERAAVRLWLGLVAGLALLMLLPALFALFLSFGLSAQIAALSVCALIFFLSLCSGNRKGISPEFASLKTEGSLLALLPLFLFGAYLFHTHTIIERGGALYGGQSTWGDLSLHLGLAMSIAQQGTFPPEYSIFPGTAVGYPFLCDSVASTFCVLGAPLRFAMLITALPAYALVLLGAYFFFERVLSSKNAAVLAVLLFFLGGGFGFAYFFDLLQAEPGNFTRIFTGFYTTPTNYTDYGLRWVNTIADMLIPQRATLFGWALLFPALYLLRRAAFEGETRLFVPLGLLASAMPLVHTHSFLALGIISGTYLISALLKRQLDREKLLGWALYALIVLLLAGPQLVFFTFRQSGDFLRFNFNWANDSDSFIWFYIKNLGLFALLLPFVCLNMKKEERPFYLGALVLWLIAEFIQFQPNEYDNNKLLFVAFAYLCAATAGFLTESWQRLEGFKGRRLLAAMVLTAFFTSGVLTLGREAVSEFELFDANETEAAEYIIENTEPDALFLTYNNHDNMVAALTGRNIFCGSGSYLYYHGLDYSQREAQIADMYQSPASCFEQYVEDYGIDYVLFSGNELYSMGCDESWFAERYQLFYSNVGLRIYKIVA